MSNKLTTMRSQPAQVSLLDMRRDSKRFPRLNTYPREKAVEELKVIISQAFLYRGQAADPNNVLFITTNLLDELLADYDGIGTKYISMAEISRVVKKSILTEEMYGISVASLYKAIRRYCEGEGHEAEEQIRGKFKPLQVGLPILQAAAGELLKKSEE